MRDKIEKFIIKLSETKATFILTELAIYTIRLFVYFGISLTLVFLLYSLILDNEPLKRLLE